MMQLANCLIVPLARFRVECPLSRVKPDTIRSQRDVR